LWKFPRRWFVWGELGGGRTASRRRAARTAALDWAERQKREEIGFVPRASELGISATTPREWRQKKVRDLLVVALPGPIVEPSSSWRGLVVHAPAPCALRA
jgi:hypothetical protein